MALQQRPEDRAIERGKIHLLNSGGTDSSGWTQVIANSVPNRLYRITNDGPGSELAGPGIMTLRIARSVWWWIVNESFDLFKGRSVDVYGSLITVEALSDLQLFGTYDTI